MRFLKSIMERSVTQANCNPLGYLIALAAIVGGVAYHFRDAVLNTIKEALMVMAAGFLVYAVIHITGHIIAHRRRLAHTHEAADTEEARPEPEPEAADPVLEAERVVSEAFQREGSDATQKRSERVE